MSAGEEHGARAATAVAGLARRALAPGAGPEALFEAAVGVLGTVLGADTASVLSLEPSPRRLVIRAASGWNPEPEDVDAESPGSSMAAFILANGGPVRVDDLAAERRCRHRILDAAGVRSLVGVPIEGAEGPYGVVGVHSRRPGAFGDDAVVLTEAVAGILAQAIDRARAEAELVTRAQLLDAVGEAVIATGLGGRIRYWNRAATELIGYRAEEVLGRSAAMVATTEEIRAAQVAIRGHLAAGRPWTGEMVLDRKDGARIPVQVTSTGLEDAAGNRAGVVAVVSDLRPRRALESRLRHAVKLEAVARLAGGVAHDFNNILGAILGHVELLLRRGDLPAEAQPDLEAIRQSVDRAVVVTRQLLAFGRRQILAPRRVDAAEVIRRLEPTFRRLVAEGVAVRLELAEGAGPVTVDREQLEQVISSLVANAGEAMGETGVLTVGLSRVRPDAALRARVDHLPKGRCVALTVTDTGRGIPESDLHRVFDPFFSTKGFGQGLGLAAVHGTVRQSGGTVTVERRPRGGTRFTVYLPEAAPAPTPSPPVPSPAPARGRVLVVEDDPLVRRVVVRVLETAGFEVTGVATAAAGLAEATEEGLPAVLVTDVAMPEVSGPTLAARLRETRPLPVLFISGYAAHPDLTGALDLEGSELLTKPFTPEALLDAVRRLLAVR